MSLVDIYGDVATPTGEWRHIWLGGVGDSKARD
jgi:hypothetical protein